MFGFFSNLTVLRLHFSGDLTFRDWLARVRGVVLDASAHAEIPFEELRQELRKDGGELSEPSVIFSLSDQRPPLRFGGLELGPLNRNWESMPWGFTVVVNRWYESDRCFASFDAHVYSPRKVRAFLDRLRDLMGAVASEPDRRLRELL
jgi:non-ribosomal peptide synthetase component F